MFDWEERKQEILDIWNESSVVDFGNKMVESEKKILKEFVNRFVNELSLYGDDSETVKCIANKLLKEYEKYDR